jgi:NADPH-dependent dioxygenase
MSDQIPVLVIGGGAGGVVMTAELLRRGVAVRTIDKLPTSHNYSKALVVHARTLEMLERIDETLLQKYLDRGRPVKGFSFTFKGIDACPVLDFQKLETSYPYVLNHRQDETEQFIREYIKDNFDYEIEWNTEATEISQDEEGVTVKVKHLNDDRDETIRARYLVACDGLYSLARESLNIDYQGEDYTGMVMQNMDVPLTNFPQEREDWLNFFITKDRFILMAHLPGEHYRLLLSDMGDAARPGTTPKEAFQDFVDEHLDNVEMGEPIWASKWDIWKRLATDYRRDNIFLVGDSAHVHSPAGGQGMNCCMQDAHNLAWKLALVVQGQARHELLDSFEAERQPIAEQVIQGASAIHQIIMGHGVDIENRFELADNQDWLNEAVGRLSGISYTYRDQVTTPAELTPLKGPVAGDRVPDVRLQKGTNLYSELRHPNLTLIGYDPSQQNAPVDYDDAFGTLITRYQTKFHCMTLNANDDPEFKRVFQLADEPVIILVRPDAYVGFVCVLSDINHLIKHMDSYLIQ